MLAIFSRLFYYCLFTLLGLGWPLAFGHHFNGLQFGFDSLFLPSELLDLTPDHHHIHVHLHGTNVSYIGVIVVVIEVIVVVVTIIAEK